MAADLKGGMGWLASMRRYRPLPDDEPTPLQLRRAWLTSTKRAQRRRREQ
jgi:hypothetical protein